MSVEFVSPEVVRDLLSLVEQGRGAAMQAVGMEETDSSEYWIRLFEANAAAVLARLSLVALRDDYVVRYCFYGRQRGDLLVRPFVARSTTDVTMVRRLVDWHPAPDSVAPAFVSRPTKDVELLYSHFSFERSAVGFFAYWIAMQELWSSARWIHSRIIAERRDLDDISNRDGWHVDEVVERCEPALVRLNDGGAQLAVLLYCPLDRAGISLHRVHIGTDQAINFVEAIPVAHGRFGYRFQ
jgi:hypothetical protein